MSSGQFSLLRERRFAPFFGVQFLGAFNDNVFKQALVILLTYSTVSYTTMSTDILQNLAQALFILPFFLFSATAGQLADKYEKSRLISITVFIELCCMALGAAGFFLHSLPLLLAALFLGGVQSALFGPVKYAILPQHLKETELVGGNGMVEMGTFVAILVGMMLGGWLIAQQGWGVTAAAVVTMGISATGFLLSRLHSARPGGRSGTEDQLESVHRDLAQPQVHARQPHGVPLDPRHLLVLVLRRDVHHAVPQPVEGHPLRGRGIGGDAAADRLLDRHRHRLAAVRAALRPQGRDRPGALRLDRPDAVRHRSLVRRSPRTSGTSRWRWPPSCRTPVTGASSPICS